MAGNPTPTSVFSAFDPKTMTLATDAARVFSGLNSRTIASVAETLRGFEQTAKLVDMSAMRETAKLFESMRPVVAPQIAPEIAETLKGISARAAPFAEVFGRVEPPPLPVATGIDDLHVALQSRFPEALTAWQMHAFSKAVATALAGVPPATWADLAPRAGKAIGEAVILAETSTASEVAEGMFVDLDDLSPAERREHQRDVMDAIAAAGMIVAILSRDGHVELASATLAFVAILVSIYWRLTRSA
jgi:hypothetical protein